MSSEELQEAGIKKVKLTYDVGYKTFLFGLIKTRLKRKVKQVISVDYWVIFKKEILENPICTQEFIK